MSQPSTKKHLRLDHLATLTLPLIERLVKAVKTHRAVIDFDAGFMNGFVPKMEGV
jgi:hypothetical protein